MKSLCTFLLTIITFTSFGSVNRVKAQTPDTISIKLKILEDKIRVLELVKDKNSRVNDSLQKDLRYYNIKESFFSSQLEVQTGVFSTIVTIVLLVVGGISYGAIEEK